MKFKLEKKPAKLVEIKGKQYVAVDTGRYDCAECEFVGSGCADDQKLPQRMACEGYDVLLTQGRYIKRKLKGEVL